MHTKRHRHFVALPLFALSMLMAVWVGGLLPTQAALTTASTKTLRPQADARYFYGDTSLWLRQGSVLMTDNALVTSELLTGTLTIETPSIAVAKTGDALVVTVAGKMYLAVHEDTTTVVALKGPAMVTLTSGETMLVPENYQAIIHRDSGHLSHDLLAVPQQWFSIAEHEQASADLITHLPVADSDAADVMTEMMPLADSDVVQWIADHLSQPADRAHLLSKVLASSLPLARKQRFATYIAATFGGVTHVLTDLTIVRAQDVHLQPFAIAWPETLESRQVALTIGMQALSTNPPLPKEFLVLWEAAAKRMAVDDAAQAQRELITPLTAIASRFEDAGYPQYAADWRSALMRVENFIDPLLSPEKKTAEPAQQQVTAVSLSAAERQRIIDTVHSILVSHGAMETVSTSYDAQDTAHVRVTAISFSTKEGDRLFSFTIDPQAVMLSDIVQDGVLLPNTLTLQQFVETVK